MPTHMQTNKPPVEIPYGFDSHRPHIISLFVERKPYILEVFGTLKAACHCV